MYNNCKYNYYKMSKYSDDELIKLHKYIDSEIFISCKDYIEHEDCLEFSPYFNKPLNDDIINEIKKYKIIKFGEKFNQNVNNLPYGITHLFFGENFNQPVDFLPHSITHLYFGRNFNQKIDNLPPNLQSIYFFDDFEELNPMCFICDLVSLPNSLKKIYISSSYLEQNNSVVNLPQNCKMIHYTSFLNTILNHI